MKTQPHRFYTHLTETTQLNCTKFISFDYQRTLIIIDHLAIARRMFLYEPFWTTLKILKGT